MVTFGLDSLNLDKSLRLPSIKEWWPLDCSRSLINRLPCSSFEASTEKPNDNHFSIWLVHTRELQLLFLGTIWLWDPYTWVGQILLQTQYLRTYYSSNLEILDFQFTRKAHFPLVYFSFTLTLIGTIYISRHERETSLKFVIKDTTLVWKKTVYTIDIS